MKKEPAARQALSFVLIAVVIAVMVLVAVMLVVVAVLVAAVIVIAVIVTVIVVVTVAAVIVVIVAVVVIIVVVIVPAVGAVVTAPIVAVLGLAAAVLLIAVGRVGRPGGPQDCGGLVMLQQSVSGDRGTDGGEVAPLILCVLAVVGPGKSWSDAGQSEGREQAESGGGFRVEFHGRTAFPKREWKREREILAVSLDEGTGQFVPGGWQDFLHRPPNQAEC